MDDAHLARRLGAIVNIGQARKDPSQFGEEGWEMVAASARTNTGQDRQMHQDRCK